MAKKRNISLNISKSIFNSAYTDGFDDDSYRYNVYFGGGGSGKSFYVMQKLVIKALKSKRKILFTRQTLASMKDSVWQGIKDAIEYFELTPYVKVNKTDMRMEFPNGSILLFKGLENIERLKSIVGRVMPRIIEI